MRYDFLAAIAFLLFPLASELIRDERTLTIANSVATKNAVNASNTINVIKLIRVPKIN